MAGVLATWVVPQAVAGRELVAVGWAEPMPTDGSDGMRTEGFSVAAGGVELADTGVPALLDALAAEDWLTALRQLESLETTEADTLIRDGAGMLRPISTLRAQVLAGLPAEGRRTFRSMYRAISRKLYEDALAEQDPVAQRALLTELVEGYALCEAAVPGADRLGDLHFEQGSFGEAARCYAVALEHPDADADDARLLAKRLHALARGGDWPAFDKVAAYARLRRGDATVRLGGADMTVNWVIDRLVLDRPDPGSEPVGPVHVLRFPRATQPTVDLQMIDESQAVVLQQAAANRGLMLRATELVRPAAVAADGRLYTLCLGQLAALHAETGETLWHRGNPDEMVQQLTQRSHQITMGYYQSLALADDRLVVTVHDENRLDMVRLRVHDKATGEPLWDSANGVLNQHSFIGEPTTRGNTLYAAAFDRNNNQLTLHAVGLAGGQAEWSVALGQPAMDPNWGQPLEVAPRIAVGERYVMVLTNNGALIAVDPVRQKIAWAMGYRTLPSALGWRHGGAPAQLAAPGGVAVHNGVVLSKDTRDNRLVAIREADATLLWAVNVDSRSTLVHTDDRYAYVLGEELVAYDLNTGERVWWTSHHGDAGLAPTFTDTHALVAGPRRMCRIDLSTGKVDGYREDVPAGAGGSPTVLLNDGVAVVGETGVRVYRTADPNP